MEEENPSKRQVAPPTKEDEKPKLKDYQSEEKEEVSEDKPISYTEVRPTEESE